MPEWSLGSVVGKVRSVVPPEVNVSGHEDRARSTIHVTLVAPWSWHQPLRSSRRSQVLAAAVEAIADAPAGVMVKVGWR